jgi:hypothetical protein
MAGAIFSPAEVFRDICTTYLDPSIVKAIAVGPLSEHEQLSGGISIMDAGSGADELYLPLIHPRFQIRCVAPTLERCELIGRHVGFQLNDLPNRIVGRQGSTGESYLVHTVAVNGGPSAHRDTEGTWEYLCFADTMMGTSPVPSAS